MKGRRLLTHIGQLFSRMGFARSMGQTFGGLRDLWATLGYRDTVDFEVFLSFYERGDIASQIIDLPADATWSFAPEIRLTKDQEEGQKFIDEVASLNKRVRLFAKMAQVDRLSGIGRFGILLLGLRGEDQSSSQLKQPAPTNLTSLKDVLFVKAFHEGNVDISTWVDNESDPRHGLPLLYSVQFQKGDGSGQITRQVHWSRIIHVAENLVNDETYGTPRLIRVINRLDDLNKLVGSAAEIFWLAIAGVMHADLDPDLNVSEEDQEKFETDLIESFHGLRRLIQTRGIKLTRIAAEGNVDPGPTYEAEIQLIASTARIPERVLFGSERGELASSQDQRQWNATIKARQLNHAEPVIYRAFFDRMEELGAVTQPEGWELFWPPLDEPTELELAEIAEAKAKAAETLAPGRQAELLVKPWEARKWLGLPPIPEEPPDGAEDAFGEGLEFTGENGTVPKGVEEDLAGVS